MRVLGKRESQSLHNLRRETDLFQTKKKVASGITNYNKKKKALLVKKFQASDEGQYMTGNKKKYYHVFAFSG